jgi:alkyl hydroperoxide reductase subunit D
MTIDVIKENLKDYAKDTKLNIARILTEDGSQGLTLNQIYGIALASAYSIKNQALVEHILAIVSDTLSNEELEATKAAATIMAMNNVYYRFVHLCSDKEFSKMPAGLRMQIIANPGIAKVDFELYALAVSAINGCGMCMDSHVHEVIKGGITKTGVQSAIKIASVVNAVAQAYFIQ